MIRWILFTVRFSNEEPLRGSGQVTKAPPTSDLSDGNRQAGCPEKKLICSFSSCSDGLHSSRTVAIFGSSGNSVGLGIKVESAEVKVDGGLEVLAVAISTSGNSDRLDA